MVSYIQSKTGKVVTKEMVWMVHPPETIYIRVWEVLVLGMIYSREHIRRRECRFKLTGQETRDVGWWKQRVMEVFRKQITEFVVLREQVPGRWKASRLYTHPIISARSVIADEGSYMPFSVRGGDRLELLW